MYLEKVKQQAEICLRFDPRPFIPCTLEEIEGIEQNIKHLLPGTYREFLLWMGRSGGGFLRGSDCFYKHLGDIQIWARELLEEDHFPGEIPENAFVFFMHQGYQFNFFSLNEGDNPPIYYYLEESPTRTSFLQIYPHFSDFLLTEMNGHLRLAKNAH